MPVSARARAACASDGPTRARRLASHHRRAGVSVPPWRAQPHAASRVAVGGLRGGRGGLWPAGELGCAEHDRRQLRLRTGEPGRGGRFPAGLAPVAFGDGPVVDAANMARQVAAGNLTTQIVAESDDEIGSLMFSLEVMRKSLIGIAQDVYRGIEGTAGGGAHRARQPGTGRPYRGPGGLLAADRGEHGAADLHRAPECRQCASGQSAGRQQHGRGPPGRRGRRPGGQHHAWHLGQLAQDRRHRQHHRGHCVPDQHPGAERGGRGGARRRIRQGFAVVAGEVRNLAQKSAQAAKEIRA